MSIGSAQREYTGFRKYWLSIYAYGVFITLFLVRCTPVDSISGTGSQAGNGRIICTVYNNDGSPASGAKVHLRAYDYIADTSYLAPKEVYSSSREALTDSKGTFRIDSVDTGRFCIEVNDGKSHATLLTCNFSEKDTLLRIPSDTLRPTGSIKGFISSVTDSSVALYIQAYGLERVGVRDKSTGSFIINDVPRGNYTLHIMASSENFRPVNIDNVVTTPNGSTNIGKVDFFHLSKWQYYKQLYLNTSSTGANVAGAVINFPVLVRLQSSNFDFSQAKVNGNDLRFTKADGTSLPYEIEHWDSTGHKAEIWVKVDTVYGNNSTQFIKMFYGNFNASDSSNGSSVFDSSDNVTAAWHLNQNCRDATFGKHDGIASSASDTTGMIGYCKRFNGSDSIKIPGLLGSPSSFTLSAWIQMDSTPTVAGSEIISIGDAALIRMDDSLESNGTDGIVHISNNTIFYDVHSNKYLKGTGWHLVAFTFDQNNLSSTLYIDGKMTGYRNDNKPVNYIGVGQDTYIGKHGNRKTGYDFSGQIDEVRVYRTAMDADYIKLSFMNQKPDDALIDFK